MRDDNADNTQTDELLRHIVINFVIASRDVNGTVLINFVIASRDVNGVTLTWLVYELSMHSDASHRLYLELRDYEIRRQFECECSVEQYWDVDMQDEDYETLRLHPAVPLDGRDIEEDDTLPAGDVFISSQKGNVFFAPYSMARMTSIWGLDAALFNPDRWLQSDKLEPASDNKFVTFQNFVIYVHAGLYTGAVKDLTYQSCKVVATILVRFFEFIRACPCCDDLNPKSESHTLTRSTGVSLPGREVPRPQSKGTSPRAVNDSSILYIRPMSCSSILFSVEGPMGSYNASMKNVSDLFVFHGGTTASSENVCKFVDSMSDHVLNVTVGFRFLTVPWNQLSPTSHISETTTFTATLQLFRSPESNVRFFR
ncbi:protein MpCYP704-like13 [Marchantia polymorpha subsp. ruderalis]|uniref:Uncharacterized protein n=2 Tax=Marchantia polymorpha TaxID=3197 RepID=A0AAF6BAU7_MARPO|nr:hypothetical protein MARPO_0041s0021 [Marchantia polymorpha]BBN09131.1 hypothetical protein Mp_4g17390 [Marchantia polymorpha subsp. ruderalis]|eukprot:PTQ40119.1 hypothetical protein MARPO_0041s0021 [Marchantia polymorpha]